MEPAHHSRASLRDALRLLGFVVLGGTNSRVDNRLDYNQERVVVEAKGLKKSAKESHTLQLEKWVSEEVDDQGEPLWPKPLLVINAWNLTAPSARTEEPFPDSMPGQATRRGQCLITGLELFEIVREVLADPSLAGNYAAEMMAAEGRFRDRSRS